MPTWIPQWLLSRDSGAEAQSVDTAAIHGHPVTWYVEMDEYALRDHLIELVGQESAHVNYESAVKDMPISLAAVVPDGAQHSAWQLMEHMRIAQRDIVEFCIDSDYRELKWPDEYWPSERVPSPEQWSKSVSAFLHDRSRLLDIVRDEDIDLLAPVPKGTGQTFLREVLLVADHTAYHVGQLVLLRRLLGMWP